MKGYKNILNIKTQFVNRHVLILKTDSEANRITSFVVGKKRRRVQFDIKNNEQKSCDFMVNKEDKRKEILDEEGGLFKVAVSIQHGPEPHSVLGFQEDVRGWWGSCYHSSCYGWQCSCPHSFSRGTPPVPTPPGHQLWVRVKQREHQQQQQFCRKWTPV